ncbi:hypothetical protein CTA1_8734, partial [Colletotrichum tanaceti]
IAFSKASSPILDRAVAATNAPTSPIKSPSVLAG